MAGKRGFRNKKPVRKVSRKRTVRKRVRISHRLSTAGIRPSAVTRYSALRSFMIYPKSANDRKEVAASWLDKLYKYGLMALKLFAMALATPKIEEGRVIADWTFAITAACQGFWLGMDDFIINSPISESIDRVGKNHLARFDYKQGRVSAFTVTVSPSSELSRRAGEYVVAVVMLSIEQSTIVVDPQYPPKGGKVYLPDNVTFEEAMQYPNAVVCPCDKPTKITVETSGNAAEWHRIGHYVETEDTADFPGGPPIVKLVIGYRDMSSSKPNATLLYTPEESMLQIEVTSKLHFREPGTCWIRTCPLRSMSEDTVQASLEDGRVIELPFHRTVQEGALITAPHSEVEKYLLHDYAME